MGGEESVCYIENLVISWYPIPPSLFGSEMEKRSSPDSGRSGGGGLRKKRVATPIPHLTR